MWNNENMNESIVEKVPAIKLEEIITNPSDTTKSYLQQLEEK